MNNWIKIVSIFLLPLFAGNKLNAQTGTNHSIASEDSTGLNLIKQTLSENQASVTNPVVRENLDLIQPLKTAEIMDEGTNDPTSSGMTLMYINGQAVYTKTQKTGSITLSIIYVPKQK